MCYTANKAINLLYREGGGVTCLILTQIHLSKENTAVAPTTHCISVYTADTSRAAYILHHHIASFSIRRKKKKMAF